MVNIVHSGNKVRITSFNCNSFRKNIYVIRKLLNVSDIVCLQETFLHVHDNAYLERVDKNFNFCFVPCTGNVITGGRPKGGLVIFWRETLNNFVKPIVFKDRFVGIKLENVNENYLIFNTYMPYENGSTESMISFRNTLAEITSEINSINENCTLILTGDFNAEPNGGRFWDALNDFAIAFRLQFADLILPTNSFTFLSGAHDTTSWIDHILTSRTDLISSVEIRYADNIFDHFPLSFSLSFSCNNAVTGEPMSNNFDVETFVDWKKFKFDKIIKYQRNVCEILSEISSCLCQEPNCSNIEHKLQIERAYDNLTSIPLSASAEFRHSKKKKFIPVPGWNEECKKSHAVARDRFLNWNNMGRPKTGHEYDMMKMSRNVFKNDLRRCRKRDNDIRNEKLAESLKNRNTSKFWAMIKSKNNNDSSTHMIDGEICNDKIADIFKEKYSAVLNNPACQTNSQVPNNDACKNYNIHVILPSDIDSAIESLNFGIGIDNIHSNHLKFCPPEFKVKLRELFNSMISHGHIPKCMLKGLAKPRIKNRFGNKHASDNYRPVMKSTNFLKMFEYCLMPAIIHNTTLHCNQFGFVRNSSTISTVTTLKEVIYRYTDNGSSVYGAFLDMSKAFDRVNFKILFDSLKGVPENIISILKHMYENQSFSVTWNGHITDECAIRNGVRQGGVISPILFNIYILIVFCEKLIAVIRGAA